MGVIIDTLVYEIELIKNRYWTYTPSGRPVPGFIRDELVMPSLPPTYLRLLPFALEVEHRTIAITEQGQIDTIAERMLSGLYNWDAAETLKVGFEAAGQALRDEESAKQAVDAERQRPA